MTVRRPASQTTIELGWFIAGSIVSGALWFFVSIRNWWAVAFAAVATVVVVAIVLRLQKSHENRVHDPIVIHEGENRVTFDELHRSDEVDLVRVESSDHMLGIRSEYEWIKRRYPKAKRKLQAVFNPVFAQPGPGGKPVAKQSHFDMIRIAFPDGRTKEVWFDISSFFPGAVRPRPDDEPTIIRKFREFYGETPEMAGAQATRVRPRTSRPKKKQPVAGAKKPGKGPQGLPKSGRRSKATPKT